MKERVSRCRSCRAPIVWAETRGGSKMPVDKVPVKGGNIALEYIAGQWVADKVTEGTGTHVTHFATCPNAVAHRRR